MQNVLHEHILVQEFLTNLASNQLNDADDPNTRYAYRPGICYTTGRSSAVSEPIDQLLVSLEPIKAHMRAVRAFLDV